MDKPFNLLPHSLVVYEKSQGQKTSFNQII